jgi:hypothetical protein
VWSGAAFAGGATENENLTLSASSDTKTKTIQLEFTADDQANCPYNNIVFTVKNPKPRGGIGIPTPALGSIELETVTGPCKRFPGKSRGKVSLVVGDELPQIRGGYWAVRIDGKIQSKLLEVDSDAEVRLIDPSDLPQ